MNRPAGTTSRDSDPLLRAVAAGDANCPDGQALARLGKLIRGEGASPGDLRERIGQRLAVDEAHAVTDDGERIDRYFEQQQPEPELERLSGLIRQLRPAPADLRDRVRSHLRASTRLAPVSAEAPVSSRALASKNHERGRMFRIVLGVAAVLAVGVMLSQHRQILAPTEDTGAWITAKPHQPVLPEALPEDWNQLRGGGFDLFALRRSPEQRAAARARFGMERSSNAVACGLRWLLAQQTADGTFAVSGSTAGTTASSATGFDDTATARQALATLALLGEGGGPTTTDHERLTAAGRGLAALHVASTCGSVPRSLAALARVEGALLGVSERAAAEAALADLAAHLPSEPGAAGLGGFALLAVETARQSDLTVPPRLLEHSRNTLGRQLPAGDQDAGRLGLAAFARLVLGYRENPSTTTLVEALDSHRPPAAAAPAAGRDALGWFFATLALREAGGPAWDSWNAALQGSLISAFNDAGPGQAAVPASAVRYAPDDLFATAIVVLDLQAAYRYLPTAR